MNFNQNINQINSKKNNLMIKNLLNSIANKYPKPLIQSQLNDINRITFNIKVSLESIKDKVISQLEICDIGGGIGLFSLGCAAYGMKRVVLIDDFNDSINHKTGESILDLHKSHGVEVISRDVVKNGINDIEGSFDIITAFDVLEHFHNSPKKLLNEAKNKLKPGGILIIGVPNSVNLRKRITVPLGISNWSQLEDWYESETFRGHVREPNIKDLKYIAKDLGLNNYKIYGRNWLGYDSPSIVNRILAKIIDYPLRLKPSLCSNLYLVCQKK